MLSHYFSLKVAYCLFLLHKTHYYQLRIRTPGSIAQKQCFVISWCQLCAIDISTKAQENTKDKKQKTFFIVGGKGNKIFWFFLRFQLKATNFFEGKSFLESWPPKNFIWNPKICRLLFENYAAQSYSLENGERVEKTKRLWNTTILDLNSENSW